jgi:hypothetical protein
MVRPHMGPLPHTKTTVVDAKIVVLRMLNMSIVVDDYEYASKKSFLP